MTKETKFHGNLTREKFFLEWFGLFGRELGTNKVPHRNWTDNPNDFLKFIEMCASEHDEGEFCRPCWISSQPMRFLMEKTSKGGMKRKVGITMAIEKLFFDFDDDTKYCSTCNEYIKKDNLVGKEQKKGRKKGDLCPECKTKCVEQPRLDLVAKDVDRFLKGAKSICRSQQCSFDPEPFLVKTRKGYHVYFFLRQIFTFQQKDFKFAKRLYKKMNNMLIVGEYEFMDTVVKGDVMRFARVPLTPHEKTGIICQVLNRDLEPTKVRAVEYFRTYGIPTSFVKKAIGIVKQEIQEELLEREKRVEEFGKSIEDDGKDYSKFGIRPCFKVRMEKGEMCHDQRLAWLSEIYHSGYNTPEKMLELCRQTWNDFLEKKSMEQIVDYFKHERWLYKPYRCKTIMLHKWCLFEECPIWRKKYAE